MDLMHPRVAGLDVHEAFVVVCRRTVQPNGQVERVVRRYATMTRDLLAMGDWLAEAQVTQLRAQLSSLQSEIARSKAIVADLLKYRREVAELEARLNALKDKLPGEKEIPTLYRSLSDAATASGLAVSLFQPRPPAVRDYYSEIPIAVNAEAEAQRTTLEGNAEAGIVFTKGEAEAKALELRAQAYRQFNEAAVIQTVLSMLPDIVRAAAEPMGNIGSLTVLSSDGASEVVRTTTRTVAEAGAAVKGLTGIDVPALLGSAVGIAGTGGGTPPAGPGTGGPGGGGGRGGNRW